MTILWNFHRLADLARRLSGLSSGLLHRVQIGGHLIDEVCVLVSVVALLFDLAYIPVHLRSLQQALVQPQAGHAAEIENGRWSSWGSIRNTIGLGTVQLP
jgi:hypothetical protein